MNLAAGQVIGGDFELLRPLGEGGMGVVWLAAERSLGRDVALKIMRPSESPAREGRFGREARALASLNHPSIISVLRTGVDAETGLHYIATSAILLTTDEIRRLCDETLRCPYPAWLDGRGPDSSEPVVGGSPLTLADLLDGGKALPEAAVIRIARDLASALAAAHAAGILHRDVKPSNILFVADGRALLADFGLAKFTDAIAATGGAEGSGESPLPCDTLSLDGAGNPKFIGSPSYAAPEAFRNGAAAATPALDWYSLGAVLYEALTGDRPRSLRTPSSYDPAHISRDWDSLLGDLLEPDPTRRLADPTTFLRRLGRVGRHPAASRFLRRVAAFWPVSLLVWIAVGAAIYVQRRSRPAHSAAQPSKDVVPPSGSEWAADARLGKGSIPPPQPVPGILGLVQSTAFVNPVTDFAIPATPRGDWIPARPLPAGKENYLPLGSETNRLRLLWCPDQGFWILDRPISLDLAAAILNHGAENRSDPVARPEDPRQGDWPAAIGGDAVKPLLASLTRLAGLPPDLISFSVPTSEQLRAAESVLRDHGSLLPDELWTTDFADLPGASAAYMPLQPVLLPRIGL